MKIKNSLLKFQSSEAYIATLGHKLNHSFAYNCEFGDLDHPLYGHIPCVVSTTKEVTYLSGK